MLLNLASDQSVRKDVLLRFVATTFSMMGEYLLEPSGKVRQAATAALNLILRFGIGKHDFAAVDDEHKNKMLANIGYLLSSRFEESEGTIGHSFKVVSTFVQVAPASLLSVDDTHELLSAVGAVKAAKQQQMLWSSCMGAFIGKLGPRSFMAAIPMKLAEYDLNSLTYAQDSKSWMLVLFSKSKEFA